MIIAVLLMALPAAVFWSTIFYHYGFRDDYSIIQEADDEPGKVFQVCAGYARPLYGVLLETTAAWIERIDDLKWMRLAGAVSVGLVSGTAFFVFTGAGWGIGLSALLSATIGLLPAAQIISSWAICWPHGLGCARTLAFLWRSCHCKTSWRRLRMLAGSVLALGVLSSTAFYFLWVWERVLWYSARFCEAEDGLGDTPLYGCLGAGLAFIVMMVSSEQTLLRQPIR
jgi:hypothetical protein